MNRFSSLGMRKAVVILALSFLITGFGVAQINTGTLVGSVKDASGGVIPGASVTVTNVELGVSVDLVTNDAGNWVAAALRPGTYEVRVELTGFKTAVRRNVELQIQGRVAVDVVLEVGDVSEEIEVIGGAAAVLDTETAQQGAVVQEKEINDLPLDGRRYSDLILLAPGAVRAPGTGSNPREARLNVNGNFSLQNYFSLNGVDNNTFTGNAQERSPQVIQPPPDALQSFKVQTRTYDAEFGWAQGAVVNAEVKSGTNNFHGTVFYFLRDDALNANDYFANRANLPKAEERRHQYGGSIGGPIIKDKTFFFFDFQRTDANEFSTATGTVPTAQMKNGIFTGDRNLVIQRDANGNPYDPRIVPCVDEANDVLLLNATRTDGRPCADPTGMMLAALYPDPNSGKFNYTGQNPVPLDQKSFDIRLDHDLTNSDVLYGSYSFLQTDTIVERGPFPDPIATGGFSGNSYVRGQLVAMTWNHIFSPAVLNSARFGFNRIYSNTFPLVEEGDAGPSFGINNLPGAFAYGLPPIRIGGYTLLGTSEWRPQYQVSQVYQVLDNLSWVKGNHSFKFGFEWKRALNNFLDIRAPNGNINVPGTDYVGDGIANLLLGNVSSDRATSPLVPHNYTDGIMFYAQDSWKASSRLTLNYGIRYEYFTPLLERNNQVSNFDPNGNGGRGALVTVNPNLGDAVPCNFDCFQTINEGGIFGRALIYPDRNNWAPRVGVAYQASDSVVLKGGYAIFYQAIDRMGSSAAIQLNPPQLFENLYNVSVFNQPPQRLLRDPFPETVPRFNPLTVGLRGRDFNEEAPISQQYSFGIQTEFGENYLLDVAYVGQATDNIRKLQRITQGRIVDAAAGVVQFPYPDFQQVDSFLRSNGYGNYNSLQVQLRKGFSNGVAFNLAYTWGKSLGNTGDNLSQGGGNSQVQAQNVYDLDADYGRSVFDQAHRLVVNWVWELPFGPNRKYFNDGIAANILGGWQFNGIWSSNSGVPLTVSASDRTGTRAATFRADCSGNPDGPGTVQQWFNTAAFAQPANFTFGNCGVAVTSAWANHNFDLSLFKDFALGINEESRIQFRAEFFNAFNVPQFATPNNNVNSGSFGQTTAVFDSERPARVIQLGLKFIF